MHEQLLTRSGPKDASRGSGSSLIGTLSSAGRWPRGKCGVLLEKGGWATRSGGSSASQAEARHSIRRWRGGACVRQLAALELGEIGVLYLFKLALLAKGPALTNALCEGWMALGKQDDP